MKLVKISKPGYSVLIASDKDLVYSSELGMISVVGWITLNVSGNAGGTFIQSIGHGLDYTPAFVAFITSTVDDPFFPDVVSPNPQYVVVGGIEVPCYASIFVTTTSTKAYLYLGIDATPAGLVSAEARIALLSEKLE